MKVVEKLETYIIYALIGMMLVSVVLGTAELVRELIVTILRPPLLLIEPESLSESFGLFLIILIGLELVKLLRLHLMHHKLRPELVIEVAIIAICNKIVTLDAKVVSAQTIMGLAALVLALSAGYYVFTRARSEVVSSAPAVSSQ
jgi:uncharacterized membrane protein (DUF373 family)